MTRIAKINVTAIRKFIKTVPKTPAFKPALQVLKKQLVNYEKYEGDPELAAARNNLAHSIFAGVGKLAVRMQR